MPDRAVGSRGDESASEPVLERLERLEVRMERLQEAVPADEPELGALGDRLTTVERRLESLQAEVADGTGSSVEDLAAELDEVERRFDSLASEVEAVDAQVEGLADAAVTEETLSAVTLQTQAFQDSISRRHDSLQDRVNTEFSHLRSIVEHLIETTEANEGRLDRVVDEYEEALRAERAEREALAAITRTANLEGVSTADCEHCGQAVDISMLQAPECPSCEHAFEDLETTAGLLGFFPSSVLTVRGAGRSDGN